MSQSSHIPRSIFPISGCVLSTNGWFYHHFSFHPRRTNWMSGLGVLCSHSHEPLTSLTWQWKAMSLPLLRVTSLARKITKYLDHACVCGEVLPVFALVMVGRDHISLRVLESLPRQVQQGDAGEWGKGREGNEANKAHRKEQLPELPILSVVLRLSCTYKSLLRAQSPVPSTWALLLLSALYYQQLLHPLEYSFFSQIIYGVEAQEEAKNALFITCLELRPLNENSDRK